MKPKSSLLTFLALCGSTLLGVNSVNATQFWDGTGVDANWDTPENWGGDALPAFTTTAINFGSLSSAAGTAFGNVVVPSQTTANNDLTAGTLIKSISFGNNGQTNRTDAYTLQGNSIVLGDVINNGIQTTALHGAAIVSSIEDVVELNMDLGTAGTHRQIQTGAKHDLRINGVISGGVNVGLLARTTDSKITLTNANNSYLGFTNIAEGTASTAGSVVEITSIANGGSNSSIGASSNAAANLRFNSGFNDTSLTTLRYIGGADASTDRLFTLYGNTAGTNSAIESSGDGTLSFTNTGAIASGHAHGRNFYLGGTNAGDNTFAPSLSDFTTASTFTKQGVGKWILTGNHTYTGATTVSEGILEIGTSGSISNSSAVTINGGDLRYNSSTNYTGTLSFTNGAISGTNWNGSLNNQTIGAGQTISPGNSPGTASTGSQTWATGGDYEWEINSTLGTAGVDPGWDLVNGTGTLNITATAGNLFNINVTSLTVGNLAGNVSDFNDALSYNWLIADFAAITGFAEDAFNIDTTAFSNPFTGAFGISLGGVGVVPGDSSQIYLTYTAIPEPAAALLGSLGLITLLRRRR